VGSIVTLVTALMTVTVHVSNKLVVAADLAVMTAVPSATPVIVIVAEAVDVVELDTVATVDVPLDQFMVLLVASEGDSVACSVIVFPISTTAVDSVIFTPVTDVLTVISLCPGVASEAVAVIVAVPSATAVTNPVSETVATDVFEDDQPVMVTSDVAPETVAVSCLVLPFSIVSDEGVIVTVAASFDSALSITMAENDIISRTTTSIRALGPLPFIVALL